MAYYFYDSDDGWLEIISKEFPTTGMLVTIKNSFGWTEDYIMKDWNKVIETTAVDIINRFYKNGTEPYGFIDRDGTFYHCGYFEHSQCATFCFGMDEWDCEKAGICKIALNPLNDGKRFYFCDKKLTEAQAKTLREEGFDVDDWEIGYE